MLTVVADALEECIVGADAVEELVVGEELLLLLVAIDPPEPDGM